MERNVSFYSVACFDAVADAIAAAITAVVIDFLLRQAVLMNEWLIWLIFLFIPLMSLCQQQQI